MTSILKPLIAGAVALGIGIAALPSPVLAASAGITAESAQVHYRTAEIDGLTIAYREAGDPSRPTVLLLHGFPTSSHMFRNLIPVLAERYHVIAPDYPGFGASDMPLASDYEYSFAGIARTMTALLDQKGVGRYTAYVMDYGAPVGFRMFAEDPERVAGYVI